jgi:hypothetical protein
MGNYWTDNPAKPSTHVRAVHINELRSGVDNLRTSPPCSLGGYPWTDNPVSTTTHIRAVHFTELRNAIQDVWNCHTMGAVPNWSVGSAPSPSRQISARDMNDLRSWVDKVDPCFQQSAAWTGAQMLVWGGETQLSGAAFLGDGAAYTPPPSLAPHDARYFAQTGYRIGNNTIWDYFQRRGGIPTFGYPTSRTFTFQGFTVQFFQRRIVQLDQNGNARLLNLLDPGLLSYTQFNGSTFPGVDSALVTTAPDPTDQPAVLAWVRQHAPDTVGGAPTDFAKTFFLSVPPGVAFPNGGDPSLLPGIDLEMWGVPTSGAFTDPNNHNFIYLRWQRGIMMYDGSTGLTQGSLLADYLKAIITGQHLPADVSQEAQGSPFFGQYDLSQPNWVHNRSLLPNTNFTNAFTPE